MVRILKQEKTTGWGHLKPMLHLDLIIEDSVLPIPCRSINVTGGLTCLVFVGILVEPGTDLKQDFWDMA